MQNTSKYTYLVIYTDGASRGNPGPAATGIHIVDGTTSQTVAEFGCKLGTATNNEAEYHALLQAVERLLELKELLADNIQIRFRLDSEVVVRQQQGLYKITEPRLQQLREKCGLACSNCQEPTPLSISRASKMCVQTDSPTTR